MDLVWSNEKIQNLGRKRREDLSGGGSSSYTNYPNPAEFPSSCKPVNHILDHHIPQLHVSATSSHILRFSYTCVFAWANEQFSEIQDLLGSLRSFTLTLLINDHKTPLCWERSLNLETCKLPNLYIIFYPFNSSLDSWSSFKWYKCCMCTSNRSCQRECQYELPHYVEIKW